MAEPLGQMVIELGLDSTAFGKGVSGAKQQVKYAMAEMKSGLSVMSASGRQIDILQAKQRGLSNVLTAQQRVVNSLKKSYDDSFVNGKATVATGRLATQLQNANAKLGSFRTQLANNASALAKAKVETTGWTGALNKVSKSAGTAGQKMSAMGSTLTSRVSTPIVAGLGLAAKAAINFDSQISAMGPLLTNGGAVTAKYRAQLDQLASSSKKWSQQYGISTTEVNNAMSEMIKRGFSTKQVLGSMPAVLDASKASGEELGTVMQATASIVEQFGLKTKSTQGTMKNTQRVTDTLTYAANATAAGFGDMSDAMSYVGPVANGLGLSVEQTAAAIGLLSNRGIEGEKAGTNLRGMLTSLVKPTKQNQEAFTSMGISAKRLQEDSHNLPQLISDISKGTDGWSKAERGKALAQAFGRENQAAATALVEAGSDALSDLTEKTEKAGGATKKVADQLNDTKANQIKRFQSSLQVLGITIGEKLLPTLTPLVKQATDVVNAFSNMDDASQQWIIHAGLAAAAAGPLLKVTGGLFTGFSHLGGGVVSIISKYEGWRAKSAVLKSALNGTENATQSMTSTTQQAASTLSTANTTANNARGTWGLLGRVFLTSGGQAGVLGTAISPLGAAVIGVGAAAAAGTVAWELWGKKAIESANRTAQWGANVNDAQNAALSGLTKFSTNTQVLMNSASSGTLQNTQKIQKAFDNMAENIANNSQKEIEHIDDVKKHLGSGYDTTALDKKKKYYQESAELAKSAAKIVDDIEEGQSQSKRRRTADDDQMIMNAQSQLIDAQIKGLGLSAKKQQQISDQFAESFKSKSANQLQSMNENYVKAVASTKQYKQALDDVKTANEGASASAKKNNWAQFIKTNMSTLKPVYDNYQAQIDKINETMPVGQQRTEALGQATSELKDNVEALGIPYDTFVAAMEKAGTSTKVSADEIIKTTGKMSEKTKQAANEWNKMIFDPKTGEIKTNAQAEVNKATQSSKQWNEIILLAKKGLLSTNATEMVAKAAIENGKWDTMTWKEQKALIRSEGGASLIKLMENSGEWNSMTVGQKEALINTKGGAQLLATLSQLKIWNELTPEEKKLAFDSAKAQSDIVAAVGSVKKWNALSPEIQQLLASSNSPQVVAKGITDVSTWNSLPTPVKNLLANDSQAAAVLQKAGINIDKYKLKEPGTKKLKGDSKNLDQTLATANQKITKFKTGSATKKLDASNKTGPGTSSAHGTILGGFLNPNGTKSLFASNKAGSGTSSAHSTVQSGFLGPNGTKSLFASNKAGSGVGSARGTINGYMGMNATKSIKAQNNTNAAVSAARNSLNSLSDKIVHITLKKFGFAKGTNNFEGGLATVNDQMGSTFREMIQFPTGETFIPNGRNVTLPLPKHSKVIPAHQTARMFPGLPQFAKGLNVPANADIVRQPKEIVNNLVTNEINGGSATVGINNVLVQQVKQLAQGMADLIRSIKDDNSKQVAIYLDAALIGDGVAPYVSKAQNTASIRNNRLKGMR